MSTHEVSRDHPFSRSFWLGAFDLRPIGLVRITLGLAILLAVAELHPYLADWFSDGGALPRSFLFDGHVRAARFCLLDAFGRPWMIELYWLATLVAAAAFTVGWRTRASQLALFVLLSGLYERNLAGLDSSDGVQRVMLFWLLFVPMGARYSVDALRRAARGEPAVTHAPAFAVRLAQLQICWEYLDAFIDKLRGPMWLHGTALHYVLGLDHDFTRGLGRLVYHWHWFTVAGNYFTLGFEGAFAVLVLMPLWQPRARAVALVAGTLFHAGIFATMCLGNFSIVMIATYPLFFAPEWIARAGALLVGPPLGGTTLVVADLGCGACRGAQAVLAACDVGRRLRIVDARELGDRAFGATGRAPDELYAVGDDGVLHCGWLALCAAAARTPALWPLATLARLPLVRALGPAWWASRARHGEPPPPPAPTRPRRPSTLVRAALVGLFTAAVWYSLPPRLAQKMPGWVRDVVDASELWQSWDMFAPTPAHVDTWLDAPGHLADGKAVDVLRDGDGPFPSPAVGWRFSRWRKYTFTLLGANQATLLQFGRFLCRRWNDDRPASRAPLHEYDLFVHEQPVPAPGASPGPWHRRLLWHHQCY